MFGKLPLFLLILFLLSFFFVQAQEQESDVLSKTKETIGPKKEQPFLGSDISIIDFYRKWKQYLVFKNAPYKGLSFHLNGKLSNNRLWEDATFGLGAFTWDFKEPNGRKVRGTLLDQPIYMGWNFKLYNQFNLSTGTTLLEKHYYQNDRSRTYLWNSYIGLSGKFLLSPDKK